MTTTPCPFEQSVHYVEAATAAGAEATLVEVTGGHFGVIDTSSDAWAAIVRVLDSHLATPIVRCERPFAPASVTGHRSGPPEGVRTAPAG